MNYKDETFQIVDIEIYFFITQNPSKSNNRQKVEMMQQSL